MHPFIKILCFILILLFLGIVNNTMPFFIMTLCFVVVLSFKNQTFLDAVRRMRWLFLSIFLIYAFGTPGELISYFPVNFAPTYEGLQLGMVQVEKLLIALAALSVLLTSTPKQQMLLGLYMVLSPFKLIGLNVERFSARLMLTLDYVEELATKNNASFSFQYLDKIDDYLSDLPQSHVVSFQKLPFSLIDKLMMVLLSVSFAFMIYQG